MFAGDLTGFSEVWEFFKNVLYRLHFCTFIIWSFLEKVWLWLNKSLKKFFIFTYICTTRIDRVERYSKFSSSAMVVCNGNDYAWSMFSIKLLIYRDCSFEIFIPKKRTILKVFDCLFNHSSILNAEMVVKLFFVIWSS